MSQTYLLTLPVKPHIARYVETIEGNPINFYSDSQLCMVIRAMLQNKTYCGMSGDKVNLFIERRKASLQIVTPTSRMMYIGKSIRPHNIVLLNRFLDDCFERSLLNFIPTVVKGAGKYKGFTFLDAYESFAKQFNITLEVDITLDTLKKIETRARKKKFVNDSLTFVPLTPKPLQARLAAA